MIKTNSVISRLFGEPERGFPAWLLRMIFDPIFPIKTIYHGRIARCVHNPRIRGRLMLPWYKLISQFKFIGTIILRIYYEKGPKRGHIIHIFGKYDTSITNFEL
jgi:hypothetical protein